MTLASSIITPFIEQRVEKANISCKTFIVTVFGDVVSQHGGSIWMGSLIESLKPLGYSERLIRTSVFRLVEDDWLQVSKVGRKSYYSLTDTAINHNKKAARRIYTNSKALENDNWLIVIPSFVSEEKLPTLKRQLKWLGFSSIASNVYAHPSFEQASLEETIKELSLNDSVIIFSGKTIDQQSSQVLKKLVFEKWNLQDLEMEYQKLMIIYQSLLDDLSENKQFNNQESFLLRLLLIHEYRRVLLKDHELSQSMLPEQWTGDRAYQLIQNIYLRLEKKSCGYIMNNLENMNGFLPKALIEFNSRFK